MSEFVRVLPNGDLSKPLFKEKANHLLSQLNDLPVWQAKQVIAEMCDCLDSHSFVNVKSEFLIPQKPE